MRAGWILFRGLNLANLAGHRLRATLCVAGIALGVTLVFGGLIQNASVTGSLDRLTHNLHGSADVEVTSPSIAGIDAKMLDTVRAVPGVRVASAGLQQYVVAEGRRGAVEIVIAGYDEELSKLGASSLDPKRVRRIGDGPGIVITPQLQERLGEKTAIMRVRAEGTVITLPVVGVMPEDIGATLNGGRIVGMPLGWAQILFEHVGKLSSILVQADDRSPQGVDLLTQRIQAQVGNAAQVLPADHRLTELEHSTLQLRSITGLLSLLALMLGAYVVFVTMSMATVERRREFSITLAIGEAPRRLVARFLLEAAVVGVLGAAVGLVGGFAVGQYLTGGTPPYIEDAYGFRTEVIVPPLIILISAASGLVMAVAAALLPALSLLRLPPAEALRPVPAGEAPANRRLQRVGLVFGVVMAGGTVLIAPLVPKLAYPLSVVFFAGAVLAAPALFTAAVHLAAALLIRMRVRFASGITQLAGASLLQSPKRTVATVTAAAFTLGLVIANASVSENTRQTVARFASHVSRYPLVAAASHNLFSLTPMDPALAKRVAATSGVAEADLVHYVFVPWHGRRVLLLSGRDSARAPDNFDFTEGGPGQRATLDADGVYISTTIAKQDSLGVGDRFSLPAANGPRWVTVRAVVEHLGWPEGVVIMGNNQFDAAYAQPEINQVVVWLKPGASLAAVTKDLQDELGGDARIVSGRDLGDNIAKINNDILEPFQKMRNVSIFIALLSVFNTMLIAVLQRRREIGVLLAIGLSRAQLYASLLLEAVLIVGVALVAATVIGLSLQFLGIRLLVLSSGVPIYYAFVPGAVALAAVSALIIALGGSLYPARQAGKVPVLEAIAYE